MIQSHRMIKSKNVLEPSNLSTQKTETEARQSIRWTMQRCALKYQIGRRRTRNARKNVTWRNKEGGGWYLNRELPSNRRPWGCCSLPRQQASTQRPPSSLATTDPPSQVSTCIIMSYTYRTIIHRERERSFEVDFEIADGRLRQWAVPGVLLRSCAGAFRGYLHVYTHTHTGERGGPPSLNWAQWARSCPRLLVLRKHSKWREQVSVEIRARRSKMNSGGEDEAGIWQANPSYWSHPLLSTLPV